MKTNYYQKSLEELEKIKQFECKPKLLIHACCAPCACFPLEFLEPYFDITIFYNNSNIYPEEEYQRRLNELIQYVDFYNKKIQIPIQLIIPTYDNISYTKKLEPLKDEPERGRRCLMCYTLRMSEAYHYAETNHFDYFTTVMTISRQKDSQVLNEIGHELETKHPTVKYFYSDFKKANGMLRRNEIVKQQSMYAQDYCGCLYSIKNK